MLKALKWSAVAVAVLFTGAQFVRPAKTNPPVDQSRAAQAHLQMTGEVEAVLRRACYDCHSNETRWPWYSRLAPVSWFVISHVNEGREALNFSEWADTGSLMDDSGARLKEIGELVKRRSMPLDSYLILHRDAKLTDGEVKLIADWAASERQRLAYESKTADARAK